MLRIVSGLVPPPLNSVGDRGDAERRWLHRWADNRIELAQRPIAVAPHPLR